MSVAGEETPRKRYCVMVLYKRVNGNNWVCSWCDSHMASHTSMRSCYIKRANYIKSFTPYHFMFGTEEENRKTIYIYITYPLLKVFFYLI